MWSTKTQFSDGSVDSIGKLHEKLPFMRSELKDERKENIEWPIFIWFTIWLMESPMLADICVLFLCIYLVQKSSMIYTTLLLGGRKRR